MGCSSLSRGAIAAVVLCAALVVTAAAAGPTIWDAVQAQLGAFAPYAVPTEGTAVDQGIEVKLVGSISDGYTARAYFNRHGPDRRAVQRPYQSERQA